MAVKTYSDKKQYRFRLTRTIKLDGCRYGRSDIHEASGALLNRIIEQEGGDAIDTADAC